jgi:hypothetical protein
MIAGIVFVILFVVGAILTTNSPTTHSSDTASAIDQKWITWLSSSGHRAQHLVGGYLLVLAALAFIWFCQGLRTRVDLLTPGELITGRLIAGFSVLAAGGIVAAAMTSAVIPGSVIFGGEKAPTGGDAAHWINELTFPFLFVVFGLASAAIIASVVLASRRSGALPRWALGLGWVGVLGSIAGVIFIPMVLPMIWYLAIAILGLRVPRTVAAAPVPA